MSGFQNAGWLSRLWSLGKPGKPLAEFVTNVNLVNDRRFGSSREHAPYAAHAATLTAGAAGTHTFFEIGGLDGLGPTLNLLHYARMEIGSPGALTGFARIALADGSALTTATRVGVTPMFLDPDPDVTPRLFTGTILTANIPASAAVLPRNPGVGFTAATPSFASLTELLPLEGLPFAAAWEGPRNLMIFSGDAEAIIFWVAWQAQRR